MRLENRASRLLRQQPSDRVPEPYVDLVTDRYKKRVLKHLREQVLVAVDETDLSKPWARRLEGLGKVKDHSDPAGVLRPGYMAVPATAVEHGRLTPLDLALLAVYSGRGDSENREMIAFVLGVLEWLREAGKEPLFLMDRGFDRVAILRALLAAGCPFAVRSRGDRHVVLADGEVVRISELAKRLSEGAQGVRRIGRFRVRLPGLEGYECLCVVALLPGRDPLYVLVSPAARGRGRTPQWWVKRYRKRWAAEQLNRGLKQLFDLEKFLVRTWVAIEQLIWLCAMVLFWISWFAAEQKAVVMSELRKKGYLSEEPEWLFYAFCHSILREDRPSAGYMPGGP